MTDKEAMKMALEALEGFYEYGYDRQECFEHITAIKEALAEHAMREVQRLGQEIEQDHAYGYASRLAVAIWQKHYMKDAPKWKPLDTTEGVLTQIDNMTCGLVKEKPAQPEQQPVAFKIYKPTPPRGAIPNVRDAELPWVYDQDPSSGNVASMWVTPVQTLRSKS